MDEVQSGTTKQQDGVNKMQSTFTDLIKDKTKQEQLAQLVEEAKKAKYDFEREQKKIDTIKANLERNKATILALEEENKKLEEQANQASVDQYGAIDFSGYDVISAEVFKNNGKIEKLKEVIARFDKELNYITYTTWVETKEIMNQKARAAYDYAGHSLLNELLEEQGEKIQRVFSLLYQWSGEKENPAVSAIESGLKPYLTYNRDLKAEVFALPQISSEEENKTAHFVSNWGRRKEAERLKAELGK